MSVRIEESMPPLAENRTKHGTSIPRNLQVGTMGNLLPGPLFFDTKSASVGSPHTHANTSTPVATSIFGVSSSKITTHITGSPVSAVKPITVK